MSRPRVVLDTNVLVAAVRSRLGASFRLVFLLAEPEPPFGIVVSVPLVLEYEEVLHRHCRAAGLTRSDIRDLVDYLCAIAEHQKVFYLWRPILRDPRDDHILEVAVAGSASAIVTHNVREFAGSETFGLRVLGPQSLLHKIGEES